MALLSSTVPSTSWPGRLSQGPRKDMDLNLILSGPRIYQADMGEIWGVTYKTGKRYFSLAPFEALCPINACGLGRIKTLDRRPRLSDQIIRRIMICEEMGMLQ